MGSPPADGSKKEVFGLRSVSNIVITSAGRQRRTAVTRIDQPKGGISTVEILMI
jgi:hypothetical protein